MNITPFAESVLPLLFNARQRRISFRTILEKRQSFYVPLLLVVEYRHVILEKKVRGKPAVTITALWKREAITFGGKFIFLGAASWRARKRTRQISIKGLLFLNPVTFVRPLAEFLFICELYAPKLLTFRFSAGRAASERTKSREWNLYTGCPEMTYISLARVCTSAWGVILRIKNLSVKFTNNS